jgi:hypothetical protein
MKECYECGWSNSDDTFFYPKDGKDYCSLHRDGGKDD